MAAVLCSSWSVSQGDVSWRRRSKRVRFLCNVALLAGRGFCVLAVECSEAAEESVYDGACLKQVCERAQGGHGLSGGSLFRLCGNGEISPLHRDHGLAAIRQDQDEIHSTFAADRLPNDERLALKGMTSAGYGDSFRNVLMMGSVSWFPSTTLTMSSCYEPFGSM